MCKINMWFSLSFWISSPFQNKKLTAAVPAWNPYRIVYVYRFFFFNFLRSEFGIIIMIRFDSDTGDWKYFRKDYLQPNDKTRSAAVWSTIWLVGRNKRSGFPRTLQE